LVAIPDWPYLLFDYRSLKRLKMLVLCYKPFLLFLYTQNTTMRALDILNRLERMDQLIRLKATGNPKEFAARLGISQSLLFYNLDLLKSMGAPIRYCKQAGRYEYEQPVILEIGYRQEENE